MMPNFKNLYSIKDPSQWKSTYNEEIKKLDKLYQEEEQLLYKYYIDGQKPKRMDEIDTIKTNILMDKSLKKTLIDVERNPKRQ
ncbi:hypothetical protein LC087_08695 [Bacillus carboniphilus]|uniref:Uncharacterized protein n=1 Tax=Bacillus carboniphilus TaxID=86663 RepID=A0ABY9K098_9BACI|nr:hypothetical protein [Bacillus carboniphilus]WLR44143.1 hypothetical protein LC087_08695 [Bacillus carboniphilus]